MNKKNQQIEKSVFLKKIILVSIFGIWTQRSDKQYYTFLKDYYKWIIQQVY